jgi:hypothetical protein
MAVLRLGLAVCALLLPRGRTITGASRAFVLLDLGVEACGRAGVLRMILLGLVPGDRTAPEALPPSTCVDIGKLFTAAPDAAAKLFTAGGGFGPLEGPLSAGC